MSRFRTALELASNRAARNGPLRAEYYSLFFINIRGDINHTYFLMCTEYLYLNGHKSLSLVGSLVWLVVSSGWTNLGYLDWVILFREWEFPVVNRKELPTWSRYVSFFFFFFFLFLFLFFFSFMYPFLCQLLWLGRYWLPTGLQSTCRYHLVSVMQICLQLHAIPSIDIYNKAESYYTLLFACSAIGRRINGDFLLRNDLSLLVARTLYSYWLREGMGSFHGTSWSKKEHWMNNV